MDILSSTLNNAVNFNPATTIDSVVSSLQLLATVASIANVSWPENSPVKEVSDWRVLVIEAGSDPPPASVIPGLWPLATHSPYDWDFVSEVDDCTSHALHGKRTAHTRGKVLGGSSAISHLVVQRGSKLDFDEWVKAGHTNWNWESVLKYFKKAENMLDKKLVNGPTSKYHCDKGPFSVKPQSKNKLFVEKNGRLLKGYSELGMHILEDPFVPIPNGTGELYLNIKDDKEHSRRASTAEEYLLPIKDKSNFHILKEAQVIKILTNDNKEAIGVRVATHFGKVNVFADAEVIICAGVFNSAKLLLLSGIGPKKDLKGLGIPLVQDLPVGENLQDHVCVAVVLSGQSNVLSALDTAVSLTELSSFPLPNVSGFFSSSTGTLDLQHFTALFGTLSPLFFYVLTVNYNYNLEVSTSYYLTDPEKEKIASFAMLNTPKSRGRVTLRSTDPFDSPKIFNNYFSDENDLERMIEAVKKIKELENVPEYSDVGGRFIRPPLPECDDLDYQSHSYWACYVKNMATTIFNPASTCAMGLVVDDNLKVKGMKKLRVVDDSVIPFVPRGTPAMITIMIAEKAADIIKKEHDASNWKKYRLTEEEAVKEFRYRSDDPKYLKANHKCKDCFKGFSKKDMLQRHLQLRHGESLGAFECRLCRMRFKWDSHLRVHMRQHFTKYQCLRCPEHVDHDFRQLCKNVRRYNGACFSRMRVFGVTVDARLPLRVVKIITVYIAVILQFDFL
ncbi:hypothetical protein MSG28_013852 [Choristoneura fumiferana]|uniref:Uncharacterized protein n=1 Tax=Choristoneura fumiferana TaxID=7141 RepID=A0ACC0K9Y4_CHOFU|nr:hypothetical protein MSG28_013852 [Choristoneura fumiferana]